MNNGYYRTSGYGGNNGNGPGGSSSGGGILSIVCPESVRTYINTNLDSITKLLHHGLGFQFVCNVLLWIQCIHTPTIHSILSTTTVVNHNNNINNSYYYNVRGIFGYSPSIVSFLLLLQTISVSIIIMNTNNRMGLLTSLTPSEFMIGMTLGLCIGGAIIGYILSASFHNVNVQCKHYNTTLTTGSNNNNNNPHRFLYDHHRFLLVDGGTPMNTTIITTTTTPTTPAAAAAEATPITTATNTNIASSSESESSSSSSGGHLVLVDDLWIQYVCAKSMYRVMNSRAFWSRFVARFNLVCSVLIAIGRPELTSTNGTIGRNEYMSVPQQQMPMDTNSTNSQSYNNNNHNNASGGGGGNNIIFPSRMPAFVGDYSTIPEVRQPVPPLPIISPSSSISASSSTVTTTTSTNNNKSSTGSGGEGAHIMSV